MAKRKKYWWEKDVKNYVPPTVDDLNNFLLELWNSQRKKEKN